MSRKRFIKRSDPASIVRSPITEMTRRAERYFARLRCSKVDRESMNVSLPFTDAT